MPHAIQSPSPISRILPIISVVVLAQLASACVTGKSGASNPTQGDTEFVTGSINPDKTSLLRANKWAKAWRENPNDVDVAIKYSRSLRAAGQEKEAVRVLQQASLVAPKNQTVIAEYGKALSATGQLKQALHNLNRAQSLGNPDWRIYSAQGITLDKLAQHSRAREYYTSALKLKPGQPSILNNIGLSYALEGKLGQAEEYLRRATTASGPKPKVHKNLALILGLGGKYSESTTESNKVLNPVETKQNIAYLKTMMSPQGTWKKLAGKKKRPSKPRNKVANTRKKVDRVASGPQRITSIASLK